MELRDVNLLDPGVFASGRHHEMFETIRREDPVYFHPEPDGPGFWCITRHADLVTVNRDATVFSSAAEGINIPDIGDDQSPVRDMMLYMDPPRHTRYRLLVNKGFTPRMIGLIEDHLRAKAVAIVDHVIDRGRADFIDDIASELPLQAIADLVGFPQEDRKRIFDWSNEMMAYDDPDFDVDPAQAAAEILGYAAEMGEDRKRNPREDIVTRLVAAADEEVVSSEEFAFFVLLLAVAGNETTRNAISHGMQAFFDNPEQWERYKAERPSTTADEVVRWGTPVQMFQRTATEDVEVGGQAIAAGQRVGLLYGSANYDETVFDEPNRFDIFRDPNPHVGFGGGGVHFCPGSHLAKLEIDLTFNAIADNIPDIAPAGPQRRLRSGWLNGIKEMPVAYR